MSVRTTLAAGMGILAVGMPVLASGTAVLAVGVAPAAAQASRTSVGAVGGWTRTEQIWSPGAEVDRIAGFVLGAWLEARTPAPWLSVVAEGAFTQRGGDVRGASGSADGGVRADYVAVSVRPKVAGAVGPVRLYLAAGPAVDVLVRSRVDAGLRTVLVRENTPVFGVLAGVGMTYELGSGRSIGVEARVMEGMTDAYSGDFLSFRNRSVELVGRVGMPFRRQGDR